MLQRHHQPDPRRASHACLSSRAYDDHERLWIAARPAAVPTAHRRRDPHDPRQPPSATILTSALTAHRADRPRRRQPAALHPPRLPADVHHRRHHERPARRTSPRSSPGTATSTSPWATRPSTPTRRSRPTWRSSPAAAHCGPARNTAPPPTHEWDRVPRPLRAPQGRHRHLRPRVRHPLHPRAQLPALLACTGPDPAQRTRITEIRDNLIARIAEAEREGWPGEAEGLKISLAGARDKLAQIDRRSPPAAPVTTRHARTRLRSATHRRTQVNPRPTPIRRSFSSSENAQPGHQPAPPGRPRQHRRRQPPPRPRPAADANAASDRMNDFAGSPCSARPRSATSPNPRSSWCNSSTR